MLYGSKTFETVGHPVRVLGQPALAAAERAVAFGDSARWGRTVLKTSSQARKARCGLRPLFARVVVACGDPS